ncbi:MAG TPA: histidinol-phosphatase HisJ family protein [Candidatus Merdenecus merdavium]|nr:histidinol-phosphatase HisJ family protein [Candidatus Merdenecus merdavium]
MYTDYHLHSSFSGDSDTPMEDMIKRGIELKLKTICFTEHMDFDWPTSEYNFEVNTEAYYHKLLEYKEIYKDRIEILFGIEIGMQPHLAEKNSIYLREYPFDFVIGSTHIVDGQDPYDKDYFAGRTEAASYLRYFEMTLDNIRIFKDFDSLGHLDYVLRLGPTKDKHYTYKKYADVIDAILKTIIENGNGLEVNTAGLKYGLAAPNPHPDILKRYKELGGEIITIGSDAHAPEYLAYEFHGIHALLKSCGFSYYTIFRKREPEFIKL